MSTQFELLPNNDVKKLKNLSKSKIFKKKLHFRGRKWRVEANNNRFAVVVYIKIQ